MKPPSYSQINTVYLKVDSSALQLIHICHICLVFHKIFFLFFFFCVCVYGGGVVKGEGSVFKQNCSFKCKNADHIRCHILKYDASI